MSGAPVIFYFDFISPYSYLASQLIMRRPALRDLTLDCRPVIFGSMLAKLEVKGPGEIPARRRYGLQDVMLLAQTYGIPLEGPPTHPFNSIYALRSVAAVTDAELRLRLVDRYFRAAWAEKKDLADLSVLRGCLAELGIDHDPEDVATQREFRAITKQNTKDALAAGAFGVPTFRVGGVLFFGHDRLPLLEAYLRGEITLDGSHLEEMLARPQPGRIT